MAAVDKLDVSVTIEWEEWCKVVNAASNGERIAFPGRTDHSGHAGLYEFMVVTTTAGGPNRVATYIGESGNLSTRLNQYEVASAQKPADPDKLSTTQRIAKELKKGVDAESSIVFYRVSTQAQIQLPNLAHGGPEGDAPATWCARLDETSTRLLAEGAAVVLACENEDRYRTVLNNVKKRQGTKRRAVLNVDFEFPAEAEIDEDPDPFLLEADAEPADGPGALPGPDEG